MHIDNTAQTLRDFFIKIQSYPEKDKPLRVALYFALDIDGKSITEALLWDKISKIMALPSKIDEALNDHFDINEVTTPHWRHSVADFFSKMNINTAISNNIGHINNLTLSELGMISLLFKTKGQIGVLADEDILEIQQQLHELKTTVINSEFSPKLRKDILHYINNMIRAFDDYAITGIEPIISATESTMGHAYMSEPFQEVVTKTEVGSKLKAILKKTISSINTVEGVTSLGVNTVTLLEHFK